MSSGLFVWLLCVLLAIYIGAATEVVYVRRDSRGRFITHDNPLMRRANTVVRHRDRITGRFVSGAWF